MTWKVDSAHSSIEFAVKHMMISTVRGRFEKFDITVDVDENQPELASITATVSTTPPYRPPLLIKEGSSLFRAFRFFRGQIQKSPASEKAGRKEEETMTWRCQMRYGCCFAYE